MSELQSKHDLWCFSREAAGGLPESFGLEKLFQVLDQAAASQAESCEIQTTTLRAALDDVATLSQAGESNLQARLDFWIKSTNDSVRQAHAYSMKHMSVPKIIHF